MDGQSSLADIFRFVQFRPPRPRREVVAVPLLPSPVSKELGGLPDVARRIKKADEVLADGERSVRAVASLAVGKQILDAYEKIRGTEGSTVGALADELGDLGALVARPEFDDDSTRLSDTLLAATYGSRGARLDLQRLALLYRFYVALREAAAGNARDVHLDDLVAMPVVGPAPRPFGTGVHSATGAGGASGASGGAVAAPVDGGPAAQGDAAEAAREIARLDVAENLVLPDEHGTAAAGSVPFTLNATARRMLSAGTSAVLIEHSVDLRMTPAHAAAALLVDLAETPRQQPDGVHGEQVLGTPGRVLARTGAVLQAGPAPAVKAVGIASLLVVKQQIARYEAGEVAHVENVIAGERRVRDHRRLERDEEIITVATERSTEKENELESADRFELNREATRTLKEDRQAGVERDCCTDR